MVEIKKEESLQVYAGRTHAIIENCDCALGIPQNKDVLDRVIAHMEKYNIAPYDEGNKGAPYAIFLSVMDFYRRTDGLSDYQWTGSSTSEGTVEKLCDSRNDQYFSLNMNKSEVM